MVSHITILGGGPAGLAVAYAAGGRGLRSTVFEAAPRFGGACITHQHGPFLFDSGAHRVHDKDPVATREFKILLGDDLRRVDVGSLIHDRGRMLAFPLDAFGLLRHLGPLGFSLAGLDLLRARANRGGGSDFETLAVGRYGRRVASRFLLNYSQKLWGLPTDRLSPAVAGNRLNGLDLKAFIADTILARRREARHLEGAFYYPRRGIGQVTDALAAACDGSDLRTGSKVTRLIHDGRRIRSVEINGEAKWPVEEVVSTLPLPLMLRLLDPPPSPEVLKEAEGLRYRNVRLVALFLDTPSITKAATVYFPDPRFPFTRVYEPRNRSTDMAPDGTTSLVAELPCSTTDDVWTATDESVIAMVSGHLEEIGWVRGPEVIDACSQRIPNAYPVLDIGCDARVDAVSAALSDFTNLHLSGRSGRFVYGWIHTMMRFGREIVDEISAEGRVPALRVDDRETTTESTQPAR